MSSERHTGARAGFSATPERTSVADHATQAEIVWAMSYDGFERIANGPERLEEVFAPLREAYGRTGTVPEWCGVDLLRGWLFLLQRRDHIEGGGALASEWDAVIDALRVHSGATGKDQPPRRVVTVDRTSLGLPSEFSNRPRMHKPGSGFLAAKVARLWEPHIAPVNHFVEQIRAERGTEHVPYIDPDTGGVAAKVLLVLESAAITAALGSGMLSADNADATAENVWKAYAATTMPRTWALHWNAVPWYVGTSKKNAAVVTSQALEGQPYLIRLVDLLPDLRVVVAAGKWAQLGVGLSKDTLAKRGIRIVDAPHPGPIQAGVTRGASLTEFNARLADAYELSGGPARTAAQEEITRG